MGVVFHTNFSIRSFQNSIYIPEEYGRVFSGALSSDVNAVRTVEVYTCLTIVATVLSAATTAGKLFTGRSIRRPSTRLCDAAVL